MIYFYNWEVVAEKYYQRANWGKYHGVESKALNSEIFFEELISSNHCLHITIRHISIASMGSTRLDAHSEVAFVFTQEKSEISVFSTRAPKVIGQHSSNTIPGSRITYAFGVA
jgi:hypothetical protein